MGVKTHRLLDRLNSFLCPSRKSKDESQVHVAIGPVRIECNRAFRFGNGLVMLLLEQINLTQYAMSRRQRIIQGNGFLRQLIGSPKKPEGPYSFATPNREGRSNLCSHTLPRTVDPTGQRARTSAAPSYSRLSSRRRSSRRRATPIRGASRHRPLGCPWFCAPEPLVPARLAAASGSSRSFARSHLAGQRYLAADDRTAPPKFHNL